MPLSGLAGCKHFDVMSIQDRFPWADLMLPVGSGLCCEGGRKEVDSNDPTYLTELAQCTTLSCSKWHMKQSLTIRLPDQLRAELEQISASESKPVSELVRESIQRYITLYTFRRLRRTAMPFAEAQGLLTDEDIFNNIS